MTVAEENLRECLLNLQPLELLGMRLLKASHVGSLSPQIPRDQVQSAVQEIINYTKACQHLTYRLSQLTPISLRNVDIPEFAL